MFMLETDTCRVLLLRVIRMFVNLTDGAEKCGCLVIHGNNLVTTSYLRDAG